MTITTTIVPISTNFLASPPENNHRSPGGEASVTRSRPPCHLIFISPSGVSTTRPIRPAQRAGRIRSPMVLHRVPREPRCFGFDPFQGRIEYPDYLARCMPDAGGIRQNILAVRVREMLESFAICGRFAIGGRAQVCHPSLRRNGRVLHGGFRREEQGRAAQE